MAAICDGQGRPLIMLLSEGQMSDYKGAALMIDALPRAKALLGDRGYDADWLHPVKGQPQDSDPSRHSALPPASQDREHVRKTQGMETHPHTLRPMHPYLHVRHL